MPHRQPWALLCICLPLFAASAEPLDAARNRLLDTWAQRKGFTDRCAFWRTQDAVERAVFLTHTDLLGNRSCYQEGRNQCAPDSPQALDHVLRIWTVRGTNPECCRGTDCCNGGGDWHRSFLSVDDALAARWRDLDHPVGEWRSSHDLFGAHRPFSWTLETQSGPPRGQLQMWRHATESRALNRGGMWGVKDDNVVELDEDYNWIHDSNPEAHYGGTSGRSMHRRTWAARGNGWTEPDSTADIPWQPHCDGSQIRGISRKGLELVLEGHFDARGNRVVLRSRAGAWSWRGTQLSIESAARIAVALPSELLPSGACSGAWIYVESASGVLSPLRLLP